VIAPFHEEALPEHIGQKGHNLSRMWRAGLPAPPGFSVTWDAIESVDASELNCALAGLDAHAFAVRSSAVEEDAVDASFAGVLLSRLNLTTTEDIFAALADIRKSAFAPAAMDYSRRRNLPCPIRVAAVVQAFVPAEASGVLFMRDPEGERSGFVVEACWGLGTGVVEGLVRPDRWVISATGEIASAYIADKDIAVVAGHRGGTAQMQVDASCRRRACVSPEALRELARLAAECERLFGSPQDIEWSVWDDRVWLLQSRPITA
jgi:phosphoenolpyruvate synthase/pyruvate phosphate dikinase